MTYAKSHMGNIQTIREKMTHVWTEINKTEEDSDANINGEQHTSLDIETRLIATARHLTLKMKHSMAALSAGSSMMSTNLMPATLVAKIQDTKNYSEQLYADFMQVFITIFCTFLSTEFSMKICFCFYDFLVLKIFTVCL